MSAVLSPWFAQQFFDNNGLVLAGGKIYTYEAGTTTPLAAYTDEGGLTPQTNPIILDGSGRAQIWLHNVDYKFVVKDSNDVTLYTVDVVNPLAIADGSITTAKLADGAVTTPKIADAAVTTPKIADGAVTGAKLAAGVGILPDLAVGPAQLYTSISAAVAAATPGQSIYVQTGNYIENVTINKQLNIVGSGRGAIIAGFLKFSTGANYAIVQNIKVTAGITIDAGVTEAQVINFWNAATQTVTDNGTNSYLQGMQE